MNISVKFPYTEEIIISACLVLAVPIIIIIIVICKSKCIPKCKDKCWRRNASKIDTPLEPSYSDVHPTPQPTLYTQPRSQTYITPVYPW